MYIRANDLQIFERSKNAVGFINNSYKPKFFNVKNPAKRNTLQGFVLLTIFWFFALTFERFCFLFELFCELFELSSYFFSKVFFFLFDAFAYFETYYLSKGKVLAYGFKVLRNCLLTVFCSYISLIKQADIL